MLPSSRSIGLLTVVVTGLIGISGCSSDGSKTTASTTSHSSATSAQTANASAKAPASTSASGGASGTASELVDPLVSLQKGPEATSIAGAAELSKKGHGEQTYSFPGHTKPGKVLIAVNCTAPGRYEVKTNGRMLLGAACDIDQTVSLKQERSRIGDKISISAPGDFWLVVAPAR